MKAYLLAHMIWNGTGAELTSVGVYSEDEGSICNDYSRGFYARLGTYEGAHFGDARQAAFDALRDPKCPLRNLRPFAPHLFGLRRANHGHVLVNALADSARVAIHEVLSSKVDELVHGLEKDRKKLIVEDEAARQRMESALRVEIWPEGKLASWATLELAARGATDRALTVGAQLDKIGDVMIEVGWASAGRTTEEVIRFYADKLCSLQRLLVAATPVGSTMSVTLGKYINEKVRAKPPVADGIAAATKLEGTGFDRDLREPDVRNALFATFWRTGNYWVAYCQRLSVIAYGSSSEQAIERLEDSIQTIIDSDSTKVTITSEGRRDLRISASDPSKLIDLERRRIAEGCKVSP